MIEVLGIVSGLLAIVGVLLNNRKLIWCFPLWLASNAISCGLHLHGAMYSLAGRDAVFFVLALDGWRKWRNSDKGA
jgi:nicotinamide riboside transporter PnuC